MHELKIETAVHVYPIGEVPQEYKEIVDRARKQVHSSYSPYSHFQVGAAALMADGEIFAGSNQENAASPSGLCAERTTLFYANAQRPGVPVKALAIAAYTAGSYVADPISPCGACRQVMIETESRGGEPMKVLLCGREEVYVFDSAQDLLPFSFLKDSLSNV